MVVVFLSSLVDLPLQVYLCPCLSLSLGLDS